MYKNFRKNRGITLVALVVTVIILLILAGISITQLTGNGLFEKAKLAKEKQDNAQIKEDETLADYENEINSYIVGNRNDSNNYSTSEQIIGTWINGKTLYQKTITGLTLPDDHTQPIFYTEKIEGIDIVMLDQNHSYVHYVGNNYNQYIPISTAWTTVGPGVGIIPEIKDDNLNLYVAHSYSGWKGAETVVTVQYTKK